VAAVPAPAAASPDPDGDRAAKPAAAGDSADGPDYSFYEMEAIGPLRATMTDKELVAVLGAPRAKQPPVAEAATGAWVSSWTWRGASALMSGDTNQGPWQARDVSVSAPSSYATKRGIRIGSTRADVERLYPRSLDDQQQDPDTYVVGSIYGGMLFSFTRDRVSAISIGVFAF
jgi:hypothetical protein